MLSARRWHPVVDVRAGDERRGGALRRPSRGVPPRRGGRRAFTLAEVLVAIGILVILAGIFLPMVYKARLKAEIAAQKADFADIGAALEAYRADFGAYPAAFNGALAKCLIGPGPWINPATGAKQPSPFRPGHFIGEDGCDGPGFRTVPNGKIWGPYLKVEHFQLKESASITRGNPLQDNFTPSLLDRWGGVILYVPRQSFTAPLTAPLIFNNGAQPTKPSLYDFSGIIEAAWDLNLCVALGDLNVTLNAADYRLHPGERLRYNGPFILWSPGPNLQYADNWDPQTNGKQAKTPQRNDEAAGKWDDVFNFER